MMVTFIIVIISRPLGYRRLASSSVGPALIDVVHSRRCRYLHLPLALQGGHIYMATTTAAQFLISLSANLHFHRLEAFEITGTRTNVDFIFLSRFHTPPTPYIQGSLSAKIFGYIGISIGHGRPGLRHRLTA